MFTHLALNKVDRIYDWRRNPHVSVKDNLKKQKRNTADHFNERLSEVKLELNTQVCLCHCDTSVEDNSRSINKVLFTFSHLHRA